MKLAFVLFQKLFGIHGGHAAGTRGRDRLAVAMVLHVAGNENTGNRGQAAMLGEQVAVGIHFEFSLEDNGVRIVADGNEYAVEGNLARFLGLLIAQTHAFHVALWSEYLLHGERSDEFNFLVGLGAIDHDFGGTEIIPAVNQVDLAAVTQRKVVPFHGGTTPANHAHPLPPSELPIPLPTGP